jgi:hypothetical protein
MDSESTLKVSICWSCVFAGIGLLLFASLAAWIALDTDWRRWSVLVFLICSAGAVLFGFLGLSILLPSILRYSVLSADKSGISYRQAFFLSGHINWQDISRIRAQSSGMAKYVIVDLKDSGAYRARQSFFSRLLLKFPHSRSSPLIVVLVACKPDSGANKLVAASLRKLQKAAGSHSGIVAA